MKQINVFEKMTVEKMVERLNGVSGGNLTEAQVRRICADGGLAKDGKVSLLEILGYLASQVIS